MTVADPAGLSVKATVELVSQGTQYRETFVANSQGEVDARRLPNAGLRWDHYQLLLNQSAVSPRFAVSRFFPTLNLNIHGAHDRIFQTPSN